MSTRICPNVIRDRRHQKHREAVMRDHAGICHLCGEPGSDSIDHVVPVAWGGSDEPVNLAPAHTSCNSRKGAGQPGDWTWDVYDMWIDGYGPKMGADYIAELERRAAEEQRLADEEAAECARIVADMEAEQRRADEDRIQRARAEHLAEIERHNAWVRSERQRMADSVAASIARVEARKAREAATAP